MLFTSPTIGAASGSLGGITASRNRFGQYFRVRAVPVQPNTQEQQDVKAAFGSLAIQWRSLPQIRRDEWDLYGENTPMLNKLGQSILLTGMNHFVRSNTPRVVNGNTTVLAGPAVFGLPQLSPWSFTATAVGSVLDVLFDSDDPWQDIDQAHMYLYIGKPVNDSILFYKGPFRFTDVIDGNSATPPLTPFAATSVRPMVAGQKIYLRATVSLADGRLTTGQINSTIVL